MPSIPLYAPRALASTNSSSTSAIPQLLRTPGGLAIMEIQGHINAPPSTDPSGSTTIGRLVFPGYDATSDDAAVNGTASEGAWMHKVYFYIGHQRMLGQVKKLAKPLAVVGRKNVLGAAAGADVEMGDDAHGTDGEQLEILDIVRWKILYSSRPEPVGDEEDD